MLTAEIIKSISPRASQDYIDSWVNGAATLEKWGFTTPERLAALLATSAHETGGWTIVRESFTYTSPERLVAVWPTRFTLQSAEAYVRQPQKLANFVYGARMGNERNGTADNDGWRYRGGGHCQLTGFDNYKACGEAIGVDLGGNPELIEDANVSLQALCWEMSKFVEFCDMGDRGWKSVCNGINRGNALTKLDPIGWSDRQLQYKRCCDVLGITGKTEDDTLKMGDRGPLVKAFQERLRVLRYSVGTADGIFGSRTRAAVLTFQAENGLATDGAIGPETRTALNSEAAKPMPLGDRALETIADLKERGSVTLDDTSALKTTAKIVGGATTAVGVADQTGVLEWGNSLLTDVSKVKGFTSGMAEVAHWAFTHWYYAAPVVCYLIYRWTKSIELQKLIRHQLGIDLSQ